VFRLEIPHFDQALYPEFVGFKPLKPHESHQVVTSDITTGQGNGVDDAVKVTLESGYSLGTGWQKVQPAINPNLNHLHLPGF
jgi:stress response protein SCP2